MQDYTKIYAWRFARELQREVYAVARHLPSYELYHMGSQLRSAALSVTSNIAEGASRTGWADYARFLNMAEASATEVANLLTAAMDVRHVEEKIAEPLIAKYQRARRHIYALRRIVTERKSNSPR